MIEIKNLSFTYPKKKEMVYSNLDIDIENGKIVGLLGRNGAGKSTMLYLIAGLLRPQKGGVWVDSLNPGERKAETLRELFLVSEEFDLPEMRIDEWSRALGMFYPRFDSELMNRCLSVFELDPHLTLNAISMGQKKKAFISFALASGTRYLLMDEPTNGLDIPAKVQFREALKQCMTDERTVIISTHQVHDVESLLDHVLIVENDKIIVNASIDECTAGMPRCDFDLERFFNENIRNNFD